ncbi:MAG: efflux RND transporter periplasmic adaptor subunit [Planctomycetota bacterium]|nr:efflux RND transporter periplasmic adaptor subunit [Planctomycetota bacterium]
MKNFIHQTATFLRILFARLRFLAVFVVAGLVVGYWDNIKNHVDKWTRPPIAPDVLAASQSQIEYYCVMHPNIIRNEPGNCPICGMPLAKRKKGQQLELPEGVVGRVQLTPQRIALANIHTTLIEPRRLVRDITAAGLLDYNETKVAQLSARVAGRADELFVKFTGQAVKIGQPIYSLYSPEVYTAQREYLESRKRANDMTQDGSPDARMDAAALYNASMQKLVLWGTTSDQLDQLDQEYDHTGKVPTHFRVTTPISGIVIRKNIYEGGYVQTGDTPYVIADLGTLWMQAGIYERDVPLVRIGDEAEVVVDALPNETFKGHVTFMAFQIDPQTRTLAARIELANPNLRLRPGMFAEATLGLPVAASHEHPATQPATAPAAAIVDRAKVFQTALQPYLQAYQTLVADKSDNVSNLLHDALARLQPIAKDPAISADYEALTAAVHRTMRQDLADLRETFKDVSMAMIRIGKTAGLPTDAPAIQEFRCPMKKGNWLQPVGETQNPYAPTDMLRCGSAVSNLPRSTPTVLPATRPARSGAEVLAVPRSAVIDTGRDQIVFVESKDMQGVFDMRPVNLGPLAGDYYPVAAGLSEGDKVVTVGAFLLDAENRLNPTLTEDRAPDAEHQH